MEHRSLEKKKTTSFNPSQQEDMDQMKENIPLAHSVDGKSGRVVNRTSSKVNSIVKYKKSPSFSSPFKCKSSLTKSFISPPKNARPAWQERAEELLRAPKAAKGSRRFISRNRVNISKMMIPLESRKLNFSEMVDDPMHSPNEHSPDHRSSSSLNSSGRAETRLRVRQELFGDSPDNVPDKLPISTPIDSGRSAGLPLDHPLGRLHNSSRL